jgi:hypothetical protein
MFVSNHIEQNNTAKQSVYLCHDTVHTDLLPHCNTERFIIIIIIIIVVVVVVVVVVV